MVLLKAATLLIPGRDLKAGNYLAMETTNVIPANREAIGEANAGIQAVYMLDSRFPGTAEGSTQPMINWL